MLRINQLNNLRDASKYALQCEIASIVPCELTLAQWALESGWGAHSPGNNCFGIKEYPNCLGRQLLHTTEYFKPEVAAKWVLAKTGRVAEIADATPRPDGRIRYACQDWFATFPTLAHCFIKRAALFQSGRYAPFLDTYKVDKNFVALVHGIAPIYATDPDYAKSILSIASMPEVQAAIKEVRAGTI